MNLPAEFVAEFAAFPAPLRRLVEAELSAGNVVAKIEHGFPAAPCGASLKLARPVSAARRKSGNGLNFYERNHPDYAGEFTTDQRHFFVLEPPLPPGPEPDMNAIRAGREARQRTADAALYSKQRRGKSGTRKTAGNAVQPPRPIPPPPPTTTVERFRASMTGTHERWHDGIGYDLEVLKQATREESAEIENLLINRPVADWCDVEALAALDTPPARAKLSEALQNPNLRVAIAVVEYAPRLVSAAARTATLVKALERGEFYGGLTQALMQVEAFHPPEIVRALLRGTLERKGDVAMHFAAMLLFLYGRADSTFDWNQRPFLLRFHTTDRAERAAVFHELCRMIGVPAKAARRTSRTAGLESGFGSKMIKEK